MQNQPSPLILTFGPADPVGALGVHADLNVFAMHACHGLSVVTGLLVADSARVDDVQPVDHSLVVHQARMLLEDMPIAAIKVGTLATLEQVAAVAEIVSDYADVPLVLDPFTSSLPDWGVRDDDLLTLLHQLLVPQASVLMLSQPELARFADCWRDPTSEAPLQDDVDELTALGCGHVLVTGIGGGDGVRANNLYDRDGLAASLSWGQHFPGPFVGAGNTLSAALAAGMARGATAADALAAAQDYTSGALQHACRFGMGRLIPNKLYRAPGGAC
ncbi:bifunctional hydroxymethylpyrimidine kinase/phosphomethylpyrimidine kinase [Massilia sp. TN1-12]|uniref:bifunctional hydroxymethylpyrimidine kinase/phosphomethylpyrimidine kinase n=1 Tax=Massilia paldalensis TaxID=3377675 RepID=UPI00384D8925